MIRRWVAEVDLGLRRINHQELQQWLAPASVQPRERILLSENTLPTGPRNAQNRAFLSMQQPGGLMIDLEEGERISTIE